MPCSVAFFRTTPVKISLASASRRSAHACTPVLISGGAVVVPQECRRSDGVRSRTSTRRVERHAVGSSTSIEPGAKLQPALTGLLDHVAEQLAREYVRLMETAARNAGKGDRGEQ